MSDLNRIRVKVDKYQARFVALSASSVNEDRLNDGGRVLLPPAALQKISSLSMVYPLQFMITAHRQKPLYAAVLEFNAEMGSIVLPDWMFQQLKLRPGAMVRVETCNLEEGNLVKLQPHKKAFVMLQDPRRVLEMRINKYPILTKGSTIVIHYAKQDFLINVVDLLNPEGKSVEAVLAARADAGATELKVEFERPLDMPDSPTEDSSSPTFPTGNNVIGASQGWGTVQFKPFDYKSPSLNSTSQTQKTESSSGQGANLTTKGSNEKDGGCSESKPTFMPFSGTGRVLSSSNSGNQPKSAQAAVPNSKEFVDVREKRLQALLGTK
ncbi:unnamed protein product [Phytomonas sp. EM1]|nr:unnamed protein product [Phytomonas sp. EM1]|eukprot:CCW63232.1 unnamed protein product [Phytomonas sp. isolate EM1]